MHSSQDTPALRQLRFTEVIKHSLSLHLRYSVLINNIQSSQPTTNQQIMMGYSYCLQAWQCIKPHSLQENHSLSRHCLMIHT